MSKLYRQVKLGTLEPGWFGPSIVVDKQNIIHAAYIQTYINEDSRLYYTYSKDSGNIWSTPNLIYQFTTSKFLTFPNIIITNDYIHIFAQEDKSSSTTIKVWHFYKTLAGSSWLNYNFSNDTEYSPVPAKCSNGDIILAYNIGGSSATGVRKWTQATQTWNTMPSISGGASNYLYYQKMYILSNQTTYICLWASGGNDCYISRSLDSGSTWSSPIKISSATAQYYTEGVEGLDGKFWVAMNGSSSWDSVRIAIFDYTALTYSTITLPIRQVGFTWYKDSNKLILVGLGPNDYSTVTTFNIDQTYTTRLIGPSRPVMFPKIDQRASNNTYKKSFDISCGNGQVNSYAEINFVMNASANSYLFIDCTDVADYQLKSSDGQQYLEYDMYQDSPTDNFTGYDLITIDNATLRDSAAAKDQFGYGSHPGTNLNNRAARKWYHRKISIPDTWISGQKTISKYCFACENDTAIRQTTFFKDIKLTKSDGTVVKQIYSGGSTGISSPSVYIYANYKNYSLGYARCLEYFHYDYDIKREFPMNRNEIYAGPTVKLARQYPKV